VVAGMASDVTLAELKSLNAGYYLNLVSFSILLYDYCLTFVAEVERCWMGEFNWATGFFYLNRYLTLFGHVPIMLEYFWSIPNPNKAKICHDLRSFHPYLAIVIQIVVASMLIMRMYALYDRSRKVLALYIVVAAAIVFGACWAMLGGKKEKNLDVQAKIGCAPNMSRERAIRLGAAWVGMFAFDSLVFCMTLYKSIVLPRPIGVNILDILFRDGAIYFGVIVGSNLANVLTYMLGGPFTRGIATSFTNIISSVMISRLVLNLRHPSLRRRASFTSAADMTYSNFTFVQPERPNRTSEFEGHI